MSTGKLYLIPTTLGNDDFDSTLPPIVFHVINIIDGFIVENIKSASRFLTLAKIKKPIREVAFKLLNVDTKDDEISDYLDPIFDGKNVGLLSEAGCPCIADPGSKIVSLAHRKDIPVIPLTGPSSVTLSLMASGLNGQSFSFHGYLPIDKRQRRDKISSLEKLIFSHNQTQIFIEAPHRNDNLVSSILDVCSDSLRLCIAVDLTLHSEKIRTRTIKDWRKDVPVIGKRPAIFLIGR
jgi:16S rRNA (cytidine1402-2'-O)-methyltransferase